MKKLYLFFGNDQETISKRKQKIIHESVETDSGFANHKKLQINTLEDIENGFLELSTLPMFLKGSLFEICINIKKEQVYSEAAQFLASSIEQISNYEIVLLIFYLEKENIDKLSYKKYQENEHFLKLKKIAVYEEHFKLKYWEKEKIKKRILEIINEHNLQFTNEALVLFINLFKEDLGSVSSELQKIKTYLLPDNIVSEDVIKDFYSISFNADDIFDLLISRNFNSSFAKLNSLSCLKSPLYLLAVLQNKLREALEAKTCFESGKNISQISKLLGVHPYKLETGMKQVQNIPSSDLRDLVLQLSDIEFKLKTGVITEDKVIDMIAISA